MKLCIIGKRGGHTDIVLGSLGETPDVRLAGVCPGSPDETVNGYLKWSSEHGHAPETFATLVEMLDAVRPDILLVSGPFERHAAMCIEAFRRGIHVISEKPAATTFEDLDRLRSAHAESGAHFATMMGARYEPAFLAAWSAVQDGTIGEIRLLECRKSYKLGRRQPYARKRESYSGTIPWVGIHAIDWVYWFTGLPFVSVYAAHSVRANNGHDELETTALCHFESAGEIFSSVSIDYLRPETATSHGDDYLRVVGTGGIVEVRGAEASLTGGDSGNGGAIRPVSGRGFAADFVAGINRPGSSLIEPEDVFAVTEASLLARRSADEKRLFKFGREANPVLPARQD